MANVTIKSTKQEIYDALIEAERKFKELKEQSFNPVEAATEKANAEVVESARESVKNNLFSEELSKKFVDLEAAIALKSEELKTMYDIDKELQNITVVVNAGKEISAKLEEEKATKKAEIAAMTEELMKDYAIRKKEAIEEYATYRDDLDKKRTREAEEYAYNLKRSREKENDEWEDEKAAREAVVAEMTAKAEEKLAEASSKANYITELEEKVNSIPELIEKQKKKLLRLQEKKKQENMATRRV